MSPPQPSSLTRRRTLLATGTALAGLAGAGVVAGKHGHSDTDHGKHGADVTDADADVIVRDDDTYGPILTTADDYTLYAFSLDSRNGKSATCDSDPNSGNPSSPALAALSCTTKWPPFTNGSPEPGDRVKAKLKSFDRDDPDGEQVTAKNHPLYRNVQDSPGTVRGPPKDSGGTWSLLDEKGHLVDLS